MAPLGPFKRCRSCPNKLPFQDGHSQCLYCLGEPHVPAGCTFCAQFRKSALRQRQARLRAFLLEKTLAPQMEPAQLQSVPSTESGLGGALQNRPSASQASSASKSSSKTSASKSTLKSTSAPKDKKKEKKKSQARKLLQPSWHGDAPQHEAQHAGSPGPQNPDTEHLQPSPLPPRQLMAESLAGSQDLGSEGLLVHHSQEHLGSESDSSSSSSSASEHLMLIKRKHSSKLKEDRRRAQRRKKAKQRKGAREPRHGTDSEESSGSPPEAQGKKKGHVALQPSGSGSDDEPITKEFFLSLLCHKTDAISLQLDSLQESGKTGPNTQQLDPRPDPPVRVMDVGLDTQCPGSTQDLSAVVPD